MAYPIDESRISAAEQELGRRLPAALRRRLLRNNGGEVEAADDSWQLHPVWDDTDMRTARKTTNHIVRETASARKWSRFPADALSLAENGTGDRIVLLAGKDEPYLWDHETGAMEAISWKLE